MARSDERREVLEHYALGLEQARLDSGAGLLELARTKEIVSRHLPGVPSVVADIGGGPGRYTLWLAGLGHAVRHRDVVPLHVEQLSTAAAGRVPELIGVGPHLIATGRRADHRTQTHPA